MKLTYRKKVINKKVVFIKMRWILLKKTSIVRSNHQKEKQKAQIKKKLK